MPLRSKLLNLILTLLLLSVLVSCQQVTGDRAPEFSLDNWDGKTVTMDSLKGKVVVLAFSYAHCSVRCPVMTVRLQALDDYMKSPGDQVYLHIGIDPENDTAKNRKKYFGLYGIDAEKDKRWMFLSGEEGILSKIWKSYEVEIEKVEDKSIPEGFYIEYDPKIVIIDKKGFIRHETDIYFMEEEVAEKIKKIS